MQVIDECSSFFDFILPTDYYYYYYNHFTTLCPHHPGESVPEGQTVLDFVEADMMWWQWHQLNHMQAICTSLQKITTPVPYQSDFYGLDALPNTQPTKSKH